MLASETRASQMPPHRGAAVCYQTEGFTGFVDQTKNYPGGHAQGRMHVFVINI